MKKGRGFMVTTNVKQTWETTDIRDKELYESIGEGYQAMLGGQVSTIEGKSTFCRTALQ